MAVLPKWLQQKGCDFTFDIDAARCILKSDMCSHLEIFNKFAQSEEFSDSIVRSAQIVTSCFKNKGRVLLCGNGGSAADAQHIAAEFSGRFLIERPPLDAEAITTNSSNLTAIGNDYGFDIVFSRQVEAKGKSGDVFIGISTSGTSKNILAALKKAKALEMQTISFCGKKTNDELLKCSDVILKIPSDFTPRIQEAHIFSGHVLCNIVEQALFSQQA
jgi:D-sedoheptulose 7-phosphate isomerase